MNLSLFILAFLGFTAAGPTPDFSGVWQQNNEQCSPKRTGDVTLTIRHNEPDLIVETTSKGILHRHAVQRYTTDGVESKSTGADGDEFHSKVVWNHESLVFDIIEVEDGKKLKSSELWGLVDGGKSLKRVRHTEKAGEQTIIYLRAN